MKKFAQNDLVTWSKMMQSFHELFGNPKEEQDTLNIMIVLDYQSDDYTVSVYNGKEIISLYEDDLEKLGIN